MTGPWVADYSWGRPTPAALSALGCIGVMRYVGPGNGGRDLTADEVKALHDAGLGVGLIWETTTTATLAGWKAGRYDFEAANRYADALGIPDDLPIVYAIDTDVTAPQLRGPVADTFSGAIAASHRPLRPYGECDALDILIGELRLMPCGWQCAAWSTGHLSPHRCLYQTWPPILNATVDRNELGPMPVNDILWAPPGIALPGASMAMPMKEMDMETTVIIVDGRPGNLSAWLLSGLHKRRLPNNPIDYPKMLCDAVAAGKMPELRDVGMRGGGDPYIAWLDLAIEVS